MEDQTEKTPDDQSSSEPKKDSNYQKFIDAFQLFPKGNPHAAYIVFKYHVDNEKCFDGSKVTADLITQKWSEYLESCASEKKSSKYIKSMESFIKSKDYSNNFSPNLGAASFLKKWD